MNAQQSVDLMRLRSAMERRADAVRLAEAADAHAKSVVAEVFSPGTFVTKGDQRYVVLSVKDFSVNVALLGEAGVTTWFKFKEVTLVGGAQ